MSRSRPVRRRHWVIGKYETGGIELLTITPYGREEVLPVFSFEEEAELFLQCEVPGSDWTVRETMAGELVSILYGPCSGVEAAALDPLPEILCKGMVKLVSLDRGSFLRVLLESGNTRSASRLVSQSKKAIHRAVPVAQWAARSYTGAAHTKRPSGQQYR